MSRLLCARHAALQLAGVCYGRLDVQPGEPPEESARKLEELLRRRGELGVDGVRTIWSSPALRCAEVAAALAGLLGARLRIDARLHELSFGEWEGRRWEELERDQPEALRRWMEGWRTEAPPGGETVAQLQSRVAAWLSEQAADELDRALLIAHAGPVRALRVALEGVSWEAALQEPVPHLEVLSLQHA